MPPERVVPKKGPSKKQFKYENYISFIRNFVLSTKGWAYDIETIINT